MFEKGVESTWSRGVSEASADQPLEESDICHTLEWPDSHSSNSKTWETHKVDVKHQKLLGIALSDGQTDKQGFFMSGFSNCFLDETNQICNNNIKATLPQKKIQLHAQCAYQARHLGV